MGSIYIIVTNLFLMFLTVYILQEYFNIFMNAKEMSKLKTIIPWLIYIIVQIAVPNLIKNLFAIIVLQFGCLLLVCLHLYSDRLIKKIYITLSLLCIGVASEMVVYCYSVNRFSHLDEWVLGCSVVSKIILLVVIQIIKFLCNRKSSVSIPIMYYIILLLIPLGSIFIVYMIYLLLPLVNTERLSLLSEAAILTVLLLDIFTIFAYQKIIDNIILREEKIRYNQQFQILRYQYEERLNSYNNMRRFRHDTKNHFITVQEYMRQHKYDIAEEYVEKIIDDKINGCKQEIVRSGNLLIDAIINRKYSEALQYDINFLLDIQLPVTLSFSDLEIGVILGNALDNAIEAVKYLDLDKRNINIKIYYMKGNMFIQIKNPYGGNIVTENSRIITTKADKEVHGIGLESIRRAVDHFSGTMNIDYANSIFDINMVLYL